MKIIRFLFGILSIAVLGIATAFVALSILFFSVFVYIVPNKKWRHYGVLLLLRIPIAWNGFNKALLWPATHNKINLAGCDELKLKGHYMMVSNHQNMVDILLLQTMFYRKAPFLKFFMKKELLWTFPLGGLACYVLGFPFMKRHTKADIRKNPALKNQDIETTIKACEKFKEFPSTAINFVEGTRFTKAKKEKQKSPYQNLLKPKAGGTSLVLSATKEKLDGFINVTLVYHGKNPSLWEFVSGRFKKIDVHYEVIHLEDELFGDYYKDRAFRVTFQKWLNDLWQQKDALISQLKSE